ncbi:MAG: peptidylprolyl isomerase [Candidatus Sumerlaeota bacterium]|nr:peptidylprolyl isomerase [Candidatus Sumerlaeota bacterium]
MLISKNSALLALMLFVVCLSVPVIAALPAEDDDITAKPSLPAQGTGKNATSANDAPASTTRQAPPVLANADTTAAAILSTKTIVLATYKGGIFTNADLSSTLALRKPRELAAYSTQAILSLSSAKLRDVVRDLVYERLIYEKANADGITAETTGIKERLASERNSILSKIFYDRAVGRRMQKIEHEQVQLQYDERKDKDFTEPEKITVKEVFLSFYKRHKVKEGETLDSIANKISRDPQAARRILRDDAIRFPRKPPPELRSKAPFEELREGEPLLVLIDKDEQASQTALAKTIGEKLDAGADFDTLAREHSQAEEADKTAAFEPDLERALPAIRSAIIKAKKGAVTDVIHTPNGLEIFKIEDRQPTRTLTFEEARPRIQIDPAQHQKNIEEVRRQFFDELRDKYRLRLNMEALERKDYMSPPPLTAASPIVTADGFTYTLEQFQNDMRPAMKSWTAMTAEERIALAKAAPAVINYLIERESAAQGLDKTPEYLGEMRSKEIIEVTSEYLKRAQMRRLQPEESELKDYYLKHIDRYTSGSMTTVREITKRIQMALPPDQRAAAIEAAKKELSALRDKIQSLPDFEQAARRESEALSTRSRGGLIGRVQTDFRGPVFQNQINLLKPGEISEPFLYGAEGMIIRLDDITQPTPRPFEEVLSSVRRDCLGETLRSKFEADRETVLREGDFQLKF